MNKDDHNRALSGDKNLSGADLSNADLSGFDFSEANLTGANLRESRMVGTNFRYADLSNADLSNANLFNSVLVESKLYHVNLNGANLTGSFLNGADLSYANLTGANFTECSLAKTGGGYAHGAGSQFGFTIDGARLSYAKLTKTNLTNADLSRTYLDHTDFSNAITEGTDFSYAWVENEEENAEEKYDDKEDDGKHDELRDYLNILQIDYEELSKNKSEAWNEIKKRYRELIAFYHPDQFESKGQMKKEYAEKKTKELNLAFEQLETYYEKAITVGDMEEARKYAQQTTEKCRSCDNKISSSVSDELCENCWNEEYEELLDVLEIDWELPGIVSEDWEEIKKQYKKLIAVNDPNQFESNDQEKRDAENRIKEINEAFEELWNMLSEFEEIDLGQDIARSWAYLASILHNRYEFDTALTFIENAIELEPNNDEWKNAKNVIATSLEIKKMTPSISKLTDNLENITSIMENADEKTRKSAEDILKPFLNSGFNFSEKEQDTNSNDTSSEDFYEKEENTNYYEIMGLARHASQNEIQKRFRELSLKFHPDKEPSLLSQQAMKRIIEAYEILKDPKKREEYDKTLA